jgi:RNA polymerase sigma factor (TIGR02999 family)
VGKTVTSISDKVLHVDKTVSDEPPLEELFSAAYEELRRLASLVKRDDRNATMSPTTLVNEAFLKLAGAPRFRAHSPLHFKRIAARAMRQVLVEAARRRHADKRGGGGVVFVTFDESLGEHVTSAADVLALDAALEGLARLHPRQSEMVELRFFGGFDVVETAELLEVSEATVLRDWRAAKVWLAREIKGANQKGARGQGAGGGGQGAGDGREGGGSGGDRG